MLAAATIVAGVLLAYANAANDNFKGVATLFGSGTLTGQADWRLIARITAAWVTTLPFAACLGWIAFSVLRLL